MFFYIEARPLQHRTHTIKSFTAEKQRPDQDLFDRLKLAGRNIACEWKYSPASQHLPQVTIRDEGTMAGSVSGPACCFTLLLKMTEQASARGWWGSQQKGSCFISLLVSARPQSWILQPHQAVGRERGATDPQPGSTIRSSEEGGKGSELDR